MNLNPDLLGGLGLLGSSLVARLLAHNTTTPGLAVFLVLVVVGSLDGTDEGSELVLVLRLDFGQSKGGGGLLVNDGTETSLRLDNTVWDTHLAAKSGKPDDNLRWVRV